MLTDKQLEVLNSLLGEAHMWHAMWVGETIRDDTEWRKPEEYHNGRIKEACKAINLVYNVVTRKLERSSLKPLLEQSRRGFLFGENNMETWLSDLAHTDLDAYMKLVYAPEDGAYRVDYSYYGNTAGPYTGALRTNYQHFEKMVC